MRKGIFAFEENSDLLPPVEETSPEVDVAEFIDSPESAMVETEEVSAELDATLEDIDEAVATVEILEEIAEHVDETVPEGGLSEPAAAAIDVAVEHLKSRLGIPARRTSFAAEGFADKATRAQSTKLAIEGWKETIDGIWTAIKNAFNAVVTWFQKWWKVITDTAARLENRAEGLAKKAKDLAGKEAPSDAKVDVGGYATKLQIDGKFPAAAALVKALKDDASSFTSADSEVSAFAVASEKAVQAGLSSSDVDVTEVATAINKLGSKAAKGPDNYTAPEGYLFYETALTVGDVSMFYMVPSTETTKTQAVKAFYRAKAFVAKRAGVKEAAETEASVAEVSECSDLISAASGILAAFKTAKGAAEASTRFSKAAIDFASKGAAASKDESAVKSAKAISVVLKASIGVINGYLQGAKKHSLTSADATLKYAAASLSKVDVKTQYAQLD